MRQLKITLHKHNINWIKDVDKLNQLDSKHYKQQEQNPVLRDHTIYQHKIL